MLNSVSEYSPFAPIVGYVGAIMAAGTVLFFIWGGTMEKWRPPDEDLPGTAKKLVILLCSVGMVLLWYVATPEVIDWLLGVVVVLVVACVACFLQYSSLLGTYLFNKKVVTSKNSIRDVRILGGRNLLPEAEKKRRREGVDIQTLLEGAAYKADLLWSREEQQWVKRRVLRFFILTLVLGTYALIGIGFSTQVILTKKAATSVISTKNAPGLP